MGLSVVSRTTAEAAAGYVIEDRFTEASSTALTSHTPDIDTEGGGWGAAGTWTVSYSGYANQLWPAEEANAWIDSGISDLVISVDVTTTTDTSSGGGLIFRWTDANNNWRCIINRLADTFALWQRTGGANYERDSTSVSLGAATYTIELTANGTSISATLNGSYPLSYSSSFNQTATYVGLRTVSRRAAFDNFLVSAV